MPFAHLSETIDAPIEVVWNFLLEKVEAPEKYVPGVQASEIIQRLPNAVLRKLRTDAFEIVESIVFDEAERVIQFNLEQHPLFTGSVVNKLEERDGKTLFSFTRKWQSDEVRVEQKSQEKIDDTVKQALTQAKDISEKRASASSEATS